MKRIFFAAMVTMALLYTNNKVSAQAWEKSSKVLSLGAGASWFWHVSNNGWGTFNALTGQLNFQGEFGVHEYVGIGFTTGVGGRAGYSWGRTYNPYYGYYTNNGYTGEFNIPVGVIANFHFYQLIADKVSANLHADKLDVYGGVNLGSGVAFLFGGGSTVVPIAWGGFQVGARYYFTDKFGVNLEAGFGKSIVNGGVVFKL